MKSLTFAFFFSFIPMHLSISTHFASCHCTPEMGWVIVCMLFSLSCVIVDGGVPTTLDGPFKPVTVPLDQSFRAVDLPDTDPLVQRTVQGFQPEQISLSLSVSHDSVWISWITGTHLHCYFQFTNECSHHFSCFFASVVHVNL